MKRWWVAGLAVVLASAPAVRADEAAVNDPGLIARAQREGAVVYYAAMARPQLAAVAARFKAAYGIEVQTLAGGSPELVSRLVTEQRGGRFETDVLGDSGYEEDEAKRLGVLDVYRPPEAAAFVPGSVDPDGYWTTNLANTDAIAYNPAVLKTLGLKPPSRWEDFSAKEWRGNFGLYGDAVELYAALKSYYGPARAEALFRGWAANQPRLVAAHSLATSMVVSGELPAAVDIYGYAAADEAEKGRPIVLVNPSPTVVELGCIALVKGAPHPNAARLLVRWLLAKPTQQWIRDELHRVSMRKDVQNDPRLLNARMRYVIANPANGINARTDIGEFKAIFNIPG